MVELVIVFNITVYDTGFFLRCVLTNVCIVVVEFLSNHSRFRIGFTIEANILIRRSGAPCA